jgi:pimeloyl-ACP methyl ester carboxylesterase
MKARILLLAVALAAGCAAAPHPEQAPPAVARPGCARPTDEVREIVLDPAIHLQVTVLLAGAGPRGVALFPQSGGDLCQFADLMHHLADDGYRVATFGPWSSPYDRPVTATYTALTAAGAQRTVVVGASQGAALALATAPTLNPRPVGVVSLSAESTAGTIDALAGVAAYPGPVLLVGTENDMYAPGGVTRRMAELHAGDEQVLLFPGSEHGIQLLPRTRNQVEAFIDRVLST